mgnify:CR=1 FL=1
MFAVIYQGYVKPGREQEYRKLWNLIARYFIEKRGAIGSSLHRAADGLWVAYSRWPDQATRDASWPILNVPPDQLPEEIRIGFIAIKDCIDDIRKVPEIPMEVVDDLLI